MKVPEYKFEEVKEGGKKVYILRNLQIFNTVWVGIDKFRTRELAEKEEARLNSLGPCLIKWEFINKEKDKNDWE